MAARPPVTGAARPPGHATQAGVSLLGLLVTVTLLPEPKGISLEELTEIRPAPRAREGQLARPG